MSRGGEYGPSDFQRDTDVPRETLDRLSVYADMLTKWQARINLVGPATLNDIWRRHMLDSAQLASLASIKATGPRVWLDLGAGAGFPGMVIAIMTGHHVHLAEANGKKCAFLREVARRTDTTNITIHDHRIEKISPFSVDIVTARAFAPLEKLLEHAFPFMGPDTVGMFLKGQYLDEELTQAAKCWIIDADERESRSDRTGRILMIRRVERVN